MSTKTIAKPVEGIPIPTEAPQENWSLDKLGTYCKERSERMGEEAWHLGKALWIADIKCAKKGGKWGDWCAKYIPDMSATTIWRLKKLAETIETPEELKGRTWMSALQEALDRDESTMPAEEMEKHSQRGRPKGTKNTKATTSGKESNGDGHEDKEGDEPGGVQQRSSKGKKPSSKGAVADIQEHVKLMQSALLDFIGMNEAHRAKSLKGIDLDALDQALGFLMDQIPVFREMIKQPAKKAS